MGFDSSEIGQTQQAAGHAGHDGDDHRCLDERRGRLRQRGRMAAGPAHHDRREHEEDEQHLTQVDDGEAIEVLGAEDGRVEGIADHACFEAGHEAGHGLAPDAGTAPQVGRRHQHQQAGTEDADDDDGVLGLELRMQEGQEQRGRQRHIEHELAQPVDGVGAQEARAPEECAQADQEQDRQHSREGVERDVDVHRPASLARLAAASSRAGAGDRAVSSDVDGRARHAPSLRERRVVVL